MGNDAKEKEMSVPGRCDGSYQSRNGGKFAGGRIISLGSLVLEVAREATPTPID